MRDLNDAPTAKTALTKQQVAEIAEQIIHQWVDIGYELAKAAGAEPSGEYERGYFAGLDAMRHLHVSEPWIPAWRIANALAALAAPPQDAVAHTAMARLEGVHDYVGEETVAQVSEA